MNTASIIGRILLVLVGPLHGLYAQVDFSKGLDEFTRGPEVEHLCSEPVVKSHLCSSLVDKYTSLRSKLWDFYKDPTKYGFKQYQLVTGETDVFINDIEKNFIQ